MISLLSPQNIVLKFTVLNFTVLKTHEGPLMYQQINEWMQLFQGLNPYRNTEESI